MISHNQQFSKREKPKIIMLKYTAEIYLRKVLSYITESVLNSVVRV